MWTVLFASVPEFCLLYILFIVKLGRDLAVHPGQ